MGMPLKDIISHAGWTNESIFIRTYLKPLGKISKEQMNPNYRAQQARTCLNDKSGISKSWANQPQRSKLKSVRLVSAAKSIVKASKVMHHKQSDQVEQKTTQVLKKNLNKLSHTGSKHLKRILKVSREDSQKIVECPDKIDHDKKSDNCMVCPEQTDHDKQSIFRKQYTDLPRPPVDAITPTIPPPYTTYHSLITFGTPQILYHQSADYQPETPPHPTPPTDHKVCTFVGHLWTRTVDKSAPSSSITETIPPPPRGGIRWNISRFLRNLKDLTIKTHR